ncbi:MAG TPA: CDP-glucose 4,6-dehydratase [Bdellovibrionota bacterium]|nr:CDP-glucose 4,6-dehydratase [Bdellovibrionota bacterium]
MTPPFCEISPGFWKNKRVLVTGHTGFKGSWLSIWLNRMGASVMGYSLAPATDPSLFKLTELEKSIRSVIGDIRDLEHFRKHYAEFKPEIVFHLAAQALVRPSYKDPLGTYATNVMGTAHVLETVRQLGAQVVVNVTSDKCYENREWIWGYRENEPMGGFDPYSSSKGCAELVTAAYRQSYFSGAIGTKLIGLASARAGNVIGGGDWAEDRLIPDCIRSLINGQTIPIRHPGSIRPWQHVLEPLGGYLLLAERLWDDPLTFSQAWNFGPDTTEVQPVSWIADHMTALWGKGAQWECLAPPDALHEAHYLKLDCSLAQSKLKWRPRMTLEQALHWVVEWYQRVHNGESALKLTTEQIDRFEELRN